MAMPRPLLYCAQHDRINQSLLPHSLTVHDMHVYGDKVWVIYIKITSYFLPSFCIYYCV